MKPLLILFSGGADSVLMLDWAMKMKYLVTLLMFSYGQKHVEELDFSRRFLKGTVGRWEGRLIHDLLELDISKVFNCHISNLLENGGTVKYPKANSQHVPARNLTFLSIALGIAESRKIDEIWIGCDYSDRIDLFPDCYQEWVVKINELAKINGSRYITIEAPLLGLSKENILVLLQAEDYNLKDIYSGYELPKER